jgi:hypothetical protein
MLKQHQYMGLGKITMDFDSPAQRVVDAEGNTSSSDGTASLHIDRREEGVRERATNCTGQSVS